MCTKNYRVYGWKYKLLRDLFVLNFVISEKVTSLHKVIKYVKRSKYSFHDFSAKHTPCDTLRMFSVYGRGARIKFLKVCKTKKNSLILKDEVAYDNCINVFWANVVHHTSASDHWFITTYNQSFRWKKFNRIFNTPYCYVGSLKQRPLCKELP